MLSINNIPASNNTFSFKGGESRFVVKIGKNIMGVDEYIKEIDRDSLNNAVQKNNLFNFYKTCNFAEIQFAQTYLKHQQDIYAKLIQRCCDDIDQAIQRKEPDSAVEKLTGILELFIKKFGYLEK